MNTSKPKDASILSNSPNCCTMEKEALKARQQEILELIKAFCSEKLNQEYFELSKRMLEKIGRKRTQPLATGKVHVWAAAIIHAIGTINFLFDKNNEPYVSLDEISEFFGTSKSSFGQKSKQIRDMLKIGPWNQEFSTAMVQKNNPIAEVVLVDGFLVPLSSLPEEYQQMVRQARAEGKDISFRTR